MNGNKDFIVDKNGIVLDCPQGTLLLDENGIVQDSDYSAFHLSGDYEDIQMSLGDSQSFQSLTRNKQLDDQSWYCISDLEISDEEKYIENSPENFQMQSSYEGKNKTPLEIQRIISNDQILVNDHNQVINGNFPDYSVYNPIHSETSLESLNYIQNGKGALGSLLNQPNPSSQFNDNNNGIVDYKTLIPHEMTNTMGFYQSRNKAAISEFSSKSSLSVADGLTASQREFYFQHANSSQTLESSQNESYKLEESGHLLQEDDPDDELFLITGHIDFESYQTSRPGSASVWESSLEQAHYSRKESEGESVKERAAKRSVSFDLLPQGQTFDPKKKTSSITHDPGNQNKCEGKSQQRWCEQSLKQKGHIQPFQEITKAPNSFSNPDISLISKTSSMTANNPQKEDELSSSYPQYLLNKTYHFPEGQETFRENPARQLLNPKNVNDPEKHSDGNENVLNKLENCDFGKRDQETFSKPQMDDSMKSIRTKSKSTTNISSSVIPVKSKYKSLSELSSIPTDCDDVNETGNLKASFSVEDLNTKLKEELSKRKKATELVEQLQSRYDNLLTRYADAEMMIDELRIGSKMAPKTSDLKPLQSPITNSIMNRALITSTPKASTFFINQSLQEDNDGLPISGNLGLKKKERNKKTDKAEENQVSKAEKIKTDLFLQANHLESKMNTLVTLLEKRQLTAKELKKVFENIRNEQDKQRREYLRVKEEFQIIGASYDVKFDEDKELEGYLFRLQMGFDELEDKNKHLLENQKEPFQERESQEKETSTIVEMADNTRISEEAEAEEKRQKFLSQYNSLIDRYQKLKISGSLNEDDQEVKEIKQKLLVIREELCLDEQHQKLILSPNADDEIIMDGLKMKNKTPHQPSNQNVYHQERISETSLIQQKNISSDSNKSNKKRSRITRSLPAPPKDIKEAQNKKCDEVSSTTSVPDSGIFEEWYGTSHRQPLEKKEATSVSLRGGKDQFAEQVNTENFKKMLTNENSPEVSSLQNRHRNSLSLAEVSSQSTETASLVSKSHGDESLLWHPKMATTHDLLSSHGHLDISELSECSSEDSDQPDLDMNRRSVLTRKAKPRSVLQRKYKPSKVQSVFNEKDNQKYERTKSKTSSKYFFLLSDEKDNQKYERTKSKTCVASEQRENLRNNTSRVEKPEMQKLKHRLTYSDSPKTKSNDQPSVIKSSNKEKLKNLQLEIESLKEKFNNGIPWRNVVLPNAKSEEISSNQLLYSNPELFSSSPDFYHNNIPQEPPSKPTGVSSSPEEFTWKDPSPSISYGRINYGSSIGTLNPNRTDSSNTIISLSEQPRGYRAPKNSSVTVLDYHSPASNKKVSQEQSLQNSRLLFKPESKSNSFYLSNSNVNTEFLTPARSYPDIPRIHTDPNLQSDQRHYCVLNSFPDHHRCINSFVSPPVCKPLPEQQENANHLENQTIFNQPHYSSNQLRVSNVPLCSNPTQAPTNYRSNPQAIEINPELQFSRDYTLTSPYSVTICNICGQAGCNNHYQTKVKTHQTQGTILGQSCPLTPEYFVYDKQNMATQQRIQPNYRTYERTEKDMNDSISLAEKTIEDINHLTKKMMHTMHEELSKSNRKYNIFYPF